MKVLHDHFAGALPVAVGGNSPQVPGKGVVGIDTSARPSGSPTYPLDVFAALSADRRKIAISVVNPTETPQDCDLNLTGVQAIGPAKVSPVDRSGRRGTGAGRSRHGPVRRAAGDDGGKLAAAGAAQDHGASGQHHRV